MRGAPNRAHRRRRRIRHRRQTRALRGGGSHWIARHPGVAWAEVRRWLSRAGSARGPAPAFLDITRWWNFLVKALYGIELKIFVFQVA
jgi:hypothetical protein